MGSFDYVTVGHVTVDVIAADSSRRPGGGAFYSALQAARLGLRTLIVTRGSPPEIERLVEPYRDELELRILPAPVTTILETSWSGAERTQRVLAWAGKIGETVTVDTSILHFAPVARETSSTWRGRAGFVGFTPQGLARTWGEDGEIVPAPLPAGERTLAGLLPESCDAVVVSEQERAACAPLLAVAAAGGAVFAVTAGASATSVHLPDGGATRVPAPRVADPRDDLGAGDVFAAAFFVALREGQTPARAAAYANAAAAIRIEGVGANAIGDRDAIEARLGSDSRA
ncbi:MAG TPA: PfkB family carbohydrate kinase [Solirubrobacteraceae bacterium]|nr:PfkB family carbohydrate kinase [Solirubrobacteraceae bacterium]